MNTSKSKADKSETFKNSKLQKFRLFRNIIRVIVICVAIVVVISFFVFNYWIKYGSKKSEECINFCQQFDVKLVSGLKKLVQGEGETIIAVENELKADTIVLCKSYSDVSYSKLRKYGISDRTAKIIDEPYLAEGAYFYLLKDSEILCQGHTIYADLKPIQMIIA